MPIQITTTTGGTAYADIRVGTNHNVHQAILDVSEITADAEGYYPPGLPLQASGAPISGSSQTAKYVVGPEAVKEQAADFFGNVLLDGSLNQDMMEDNLGRVLSANEIAALAAGGFKLIYTA